MKIIAPYAYFAPEHAASSYLWQNLHEDFAEEGIECVVYTPYPTRGVSDQTRNEYKSCKCTELLYDNRLTIVRFPLYKEGRNSILRAFRYLLSCVMQYFLCVYGKNSKGGSVLFMASTPPIIGMVGALIKKRTGIPFVYNLQDVFPDSLVSTGLAKKGGLLWKIGRCIEDFTYKNADKIIVISNGFKSNIMSKGVPEHKISVIRNWVDVNAVFPIPRENNKLIKKYGLDPSKFYVTYNGNIGLTQNIEMLLQAAEELKSDKRIHFVIVGDGACRSFIEEHINTKGADNVSLLPFQPYEDISHVFSLGDVSLVISKPNVGDNSVPSKTWSIMSASRPVLASFDGKELKQIIEENHCGIFTEANDIIALKNAILHLCDNRELCEIYGKNGRNFVVNHLARKQGTHRYAEVIKSVLAQ